MVPFVVHWNRETPTAIPYPAATQELAVALAMEARKDLSLGPSGWSSGREGLITAGDGVKRDVLLIESWIPELNPHLVFIHYFQKRPFSLVGPFMFQDHAQRKTPEERRHFMSQFHRGIAAHAFGAQCARAIEASKKSW